MAAKLVLMLAMMMAEMKGRYQVEKLVAHLVNGEVVAMAV